MKSCDLLGEVIESCSNLYHYMLLKRFYVLTPKSKTKKIILLWLNTIIPLLVMAWLGVLIYPQAEYQQPFVACYF